MVANRRTGISASQSASTSMDADTTTLYAIYQGNDVSGTTTYVTLNIYSTTNSIYTTVTMYRNSYFTSVSGSGTMNTILNGSTTAITNYSTAVGPGGSVWTGLSTAADTTPEYSTAADAAIASATTLHTVYTMNIAYQMGANVTAIGKESDSCKITTGSTACNVTLPSITPIDGYESAGWSTTNGATTGVTGTYSNSSNSTLLFGNAKGKTYTVTYNDNLFKGQSADYSGLTVTWNPQDSTITLNGSTVWTTTARVDMDYIYPTLTLNDQYKISVTHLSGTYTGTASSTRFIVSAEVQNNSGNVSPRNYADVVAGTNNGTVSNTLTISSSGATGTRISCLLYFNEGMNKYTFTNYKIKVNLTKVYSTKTVTYKNTYGALQSMSKSGYTFDGWSLVPDGYEQVEYITFSGAQTIDTGVSPSMYNGNYKIEVGEKHTNTSSSYLISGSGGGSAAASRANLQLNAGTKLYGYVDKTDYSTYDRMLRNITTGVKNDIIFDVNQSESVRKLSLNGSEITSTTEFVSQSTTNFKLSGHASQMFSGQIYYLKIYGNGELVRYMVPCKRYDGVIGMYDVVEDVFYENTKSGDPFPDSGLGPVQYITSSTVEDIEANHTLYAKWTANETHIVLNYNMTGTTFGEKKMIDTDFKPNWSNSFDVDISFNPGTSGKRYLLFGNYGYGTGTSSSTLQTNTLSIEVTTGNKVRVYVGTGSLDTTFGSVTIGSVNTLHVSWDGNTKILTASLNNASSGSNYYSSSAISALTGTCQRSLRFGALDYREGSSSTTVFSPITVSNFVITQHYPEGLSSNYTLPNPFGHLLLFNGWTGTGLSGSGYSKSISSSSGGTITATASAWTSYTTSSYASSAYNTSNSNLKYKLRVDHEYTDKARSIAYCSASALFYKTYDANTDGNGSITVSFNGTSTSNSWSYGDGYAVTYSGTNLWTRYWSARSNTFEAITLDSSGNASVSISMTSFSHSMFTVSNSTPVTYSFTLSGISQ